MPPLSKKNSAGKRKPSKRRAPRATPSGAPQATARGGVFDRDILGMSFPPIDIRRTAFFLDFDGTLAEIVDDPDKAAISEANFAALQKLAEAADDAVAVVSGRSIAQLDRLLHPLRLPLAGVHGLERRTADGRLVNAPIDEDAQRTLQAGVKTFADANPGLLAEAKPGSVALHYRMRPDLAAECARLADELARHDPRIEVVAGKMVFEIKLGALTKGDAISAFMEESPFRGRVPFFAGDDVTDETGFKVVNAMGGISLKVGSGKTFADHRVMDTASFTAGFEALVMNSPAAGKVT
ncbi:trehalose-phosphatase [Mesorhizobium sp. CAU 1741]|uniref:trehalose-phosphatase n=1 Tax=Mesorhizobium sp. CAU 1741 TaxID=3140366 RepID=UPI00325B09D7